MRHTQYTLTARDVTSLTLQTLLEGLAWNSTPVESRVLVQLLVRAAAQMRSLAAVLIASTITSSYETIRQAILKKLPDEPVDFIPTAAHLLNQLIPAKLIKRPQIMAVDLHLRPYYGKKSTRGITRGQRKAGTTTFFAYATIMLIRSGQLYTIGSTPVVKGEDLTTILERLVSQAREARFTIKCLLLDREFYAAKVLAWLQKESIAFIVPMIRRGKKGKRIVDCTGTQKFFVKNRHGWDKYTWTAASRRNRGQGAISVTIDVCMAAVAPKKGKGKKQLAYACHGVSGNVKSIVERYRRRFGIETSYRQLGEGLAMTCSRHATYRFLLVVIALVLRNMWLWLHWEKLSQKSSKGDRVLNQRHMRLRTMMGWLVVELDIRLNIEAKVISSG